MKWSFYSLETGEFTGRRFSSPFEHELKIPEGQGAVEGYHDPASSRVDLETGQVVEWENAKFIAARDAHARVVAAIAERTALEREQIRSISELLEEPENAEARAHFNRRRARLDELRLVISETETSEPESKGR